MTVAYINRIGTAVPDHDVHEAYIRFVDSVLPDRRSQLLFRRMAQRAEIQHRYSFLKPGETMEEAVDTEGFLRRGAFPTTGARMARYARYGVELAERAVDALDLGAARDEITHLVVASCTGFSAPGVDQQLQERLGLRADLERTQVGFMGCSAAVNALKVAHHIVRSEPEAKVLVINLELCTLHMQETPDLERSLSSLLFGDGCAATLVTAEPAGVALKDFRAKTIPGTQGLITWDIGDQGFDMHLSGDVPSQIQRALRHEAALNDESGIFRGQTKHDFDLWAVHAGGRTVLDAVEQGLELDPEKLRWSRGVLADFGNMSSATVMFVLDRMMRTVKGAAEGFGMAFGPGLVAETFRFRLTG
ncbi:type III polyketide synthase [Salinarimonas soli]|uniref:Type III polyketide synthase n=1 Tax=Salinarimonas soli TaxID=1638099 RepID=A0A5B2VD53_9HYPH|nr:type III polyketide synthase [Salinarimonas soli]KAA2237001.1 type III polyketide synthase [Salinarimonas soli]